MDHMEGWPKKKKLINERIAMTYKCHCFISKIYGHCNFCLTLSKGPHVSGTEWIRKLFIQHVQGGH